MGSPWLGHVGMLYTLEELACVYMVGLGREGIFDRVGHFNFSCYVYGFR